MKTCRDFLRVLMCCGMAVSFSTVGCGDDNVIGGGSPPQPPPPTMASIPAGVFNMGDNFAEGNANELPVHAVTISAFEMDLREVTNTKYTECVTAGECTPPVLSSSATRPSYYGNPAYGNYPVIYVDWNQARAYCTWVGGRLPTEAEWEWAARGGLAGNRYPWGNAITGTDANYLISGDPEDNDTNAVGSYAVNGYGLYDMAGNVWEWVEDDYHNSYTGAPADGSAWVDTPRATARVLRGGSWYVFTGDLRVTDRHSRISGHGYDNFGFRCTR